MALQTWFTLSLLALACGMLYLTLGIGAVARQVPLLVVVPLVGLLALQLGRDLRTARSFEPATPRTGPKETGGRQSALAWILLLPVLSGLLGIVWGPGVFAFVYLRARSREPWRLALTGSALTSFAMWTLFSVILGTA
jgi:hypothetical protein